MVSICIPVPNNSTIQNQWDFLLSHFEIDTLYLLGDKELETKSKSFQNYNLIGDGGYLPIDKPLVVMSPKNARYIKGVTSLLDFKHPKDAIYFFGADNVHLYDELGDRKADHLVYIPTYTDYEMYSFIAAGITLYDKILKEHNG